MMIIYI